MNLTGLKRNELSWKKGIIMDNKEPKGSLVAAAFIGAIGILLGIAAVSGAADLAAMAIKALAKTMGW
jgi:hypothetical protein